MALSFLSGVIILEKLKSVQHSVDVMIMELLSLQKIVMNLYHQQLLQQLPQQQQQQMDAVEATEQQQLSE